MATAFALWWERYVPRLYIRQFVDTIARIMGSRQHSDSLGNDFVDILVVNTDGGIEYPDYLRAHRDGGSRTPYALAGTEFDDLMHDPIFRTLLALRDHLPGECHSCCEQDVCGGGFLGGRAGAAGFEHFRRSVLCYDQFHYFQAVRRIIAPYLDILNEEPQRTPADFRASHEHHGLSHLD
jgi:uncharacterized protein